MHSPSMFVDTVIRQGIRGDGDQWPQIWKTRPEAIEGRHMRAMQLPRPSRPKALPRIMQVPYVEVSDLRTLGG